MSSALRGRRVLVVEDQAPVALFLVRALRQTEAQVMGPVRNANEAEWMLAVERPDIAVLDITLGDGDVLPLADRLSANGIPFVLFTGQDDPTYVTRRFPDVPVVSKMSADELIPTLAAVAASLASDEPARPPPPDDANHEAAPT